MATPGLPGRSVPASDADSELANEVHEARLEIVRLRAHLARLSRERDELSFNLLALMEQSGRERQQLRHIRSSVSWRITLPLRLLRGRIRDRRGMRPGR